MEDQPMHCPNPDPGPAWWELVAAGVAMLWVGLGVPTALAWLWFRFGGGDR